MTALAAVVGAVIGAVVFAVCAWLAQLTPPPPSVQWVRLTPPAGVESYVSWLPCVRTGWWRGVTCFPTESRSAELTLHDSEGVEENAGPPGSEGEH